MADKGTKPESVVAAVATAKSAKEVAGALIAKQKEEQRLAAQERTAKVAADRAAAAALSAKAISDKAAAKAEADQKAAIEAVAGHPMVTNNHDTPLRVGGIVIGPNQTLPVGLFNKDNSLMKQWIAAKVITVKMPK